MLTSTSPNSILLASLDATRGKSSCTLQFIDEYDCLYIDQFTGNKGIEIISTTVNAIEEIKEIIRESYLKGYYFKCNYLPKIF